MGETLYAPGDVVSFDGDDYLIVSIGPGRISDALRYEMRDRNVVGRTVFRYVGEFDERTDVVLVTTDEDFDAELDVVAIDGEPVDEVEVEEFDSFLAALAVEPEDEDDDVDEIDD